MDRRTRLNITPNPSGCTNAQASSIASLFHEACWEMAKSDARIYRSVGQYITRTQEILRQAEDGSGFVQLAEPSIELLSVAAPTYDKQTRKSLENHCKAHGISGYSRLNKKQIVSLLQGNKIPPPPVPIEALTKAELIELLRQAIFQYNRNV